MMNILDKRVILLLISGVVLAYMLVQGFIEHRVALRCRSKENETNVSHAAKTFGNIVTFNKATASKLDYIAMMHTDPRVNCRAMMHGDQEAISEAKRIAEASLQSENKYIQFEHTVIQESRICSRFLSQYGFITDVLSEEESKFPIAFSIIAYKDTEMLMRLLRAIYRVQNVYCIHVDFKADGVARAISAVASCLPNVFITSRRYDVQWAGFSVLGAELVCLEDLWRDKRWRYVINLTGQEFPLKTNLEIVKILKAYKGANDAPGTTSYALPKDRDLKPFPPFPHNLTTVKGPVHVTLSRPFVDFILHDKRALDLREALKMAWGPDEYFFSTLNNNPQLGIPGTFQGNLTQIQPSFDSKREYEFIGNISFNRYKMWMYEKSGVCATNFVVKSICILSSGDLPRLAASHSLFANKFYLGHDRVVIGCLEEMLMNRTRDYYMGQRTFDTTIYENSPIVKNKIVKTTKFLDRSG